MTADTLPPLDIKTCPVGSRVKFLEEKMRYTVQARSQRYLVCTRPFNLRRTVLYCIIDLEARTRAPSDRLFPDPVNSTEQCRLLVWKLLRGQVGLSQRRKLALNIEKVERPRKS